MRIVTCQITEDLLPPSSAKGLGKAFLDLTRLLDYVLWVPVSPSQRICSIHTGHGQIKSKRIRINLPLRCFWERLHKVSSLVIQNTLYP